MKYYLLLFLLIFSCTPGEPEELVHECNGVVECNDSDYHCGDLTILQQFINLNGQIFKHYLDTNENGCIEPLEFGAQNWSNSRLISLDLNYHEEEIIDPNNPSQFDTQNHRITQLPEDIGDLDSLKILKLNDNELIYLPGSFSNLLQLKHLELENNFLTELPMDLGNLINLEQLVINSNLIVHLPGTIGNLASLEKLFANHNRLEYIPESIGYLSQLEWLYLNNNFLQALPLSIGNLENLIILSIDNNILSDLPDNLCNIYPCETDAEGHCLSGLEIFSVSNNSLCPGSYPSCIANDDVGNQTCTDCPPNYFMVDGYCAFEADYQILQNFLDLNPESQSLPNNTGVPQDASECVNEDWWDGGRLVEITFYHKQLTSEIPANFGELDHLRVLQLTGNELMGEIPDEIMNLNNLKIIKFNSNNFSGNIPENIGSLSNLDTLWLNNNNFTGEIPTSIADLGGLQFLGLQENNLSGVIPFNIGNMDSLKYLYLDNNQLGCYDYDFIEDDCITHCDDSNGICSGEIPESIGNLINLRRLYLLNNHFSGQIPESICTNYSINEYFRSFLNNNQLCPEYPTCIPESHIGIQDTTECVDEVDE